MSGPESVNERDVLLSGGFGTSSNSARAGFLPIPLSYVPSGSYDRIPFYLRSGKDDHDARDGDSFRLYRSENIEFTEQHRARLIGEGIKFVYIRMADQTRFHRQIESRLQEIAEDPSSAISDRAAIVYETSLELMNELLSDPDLAKQSGRLDQVARAVTTLAINDETAFSHLFAASHHDFYTATHMVNVATWMVPLAYAMGHRDFDELRTLCIAGLLHDIGKIYIPEEILNKAGKLTDEERALIREHPERGVKHLQHYENIDPLVFTITREHHERMDGSGYPLGLSADQIHPLSRLCAVVDSFDAMTAFRPFKSRTLSAKEAIDILRRETPAKYDPEVMDAWVRLIGGEMSGMVEDQHEGAEDSECSSNRRRYARVSFNSPGRVHILEQGPRGWCERPGIPVVVHSISQSGLGFLCKAKVQPGESVHVYLQDEHYDVKRLEGEIVRCRSHQDGWNEIGMHFNILQPNLDWLKRLARCEKPSPISTS